MTSERPYRAALGVDEALGEVERCTGTQFDPVVAHAFLEAFAAGEIDDRLPIAV
jgi:HD-GYP domain-containing protein (c-di-GMP phosphodiesterase class II)